jgi:pentatricopeptide repeat protein
MYAKCRNLEKARQVFDKMSERDVVSWNAIIAGYGRNGHIDEALSLLREMQLQGMIPDGVTLVSVLQACAHSSARQQGMGIHNYIIRREFEFNIFVGNSLIDMYANCGCVDIARRVFDRMSVRDVISWSAMISGYTQVGLANEALAVFHQMQLAAVMPGAATIVSVLQACAYLESLQLGECVHDYILKHGLLSDVIVGTSLMDMYAQCGSLEIAHQMFDEMSKRDVISWNTMIARYTQSGDVNDAMSLFHDMLLADVTPTSLTMISVLPACAQLATLQTAMQGLWKRDGNFLIA